MGRGGILMFPAFLVICHCFVLFCFVNFIYFWLRWVFFASRAFSLVAVRGGFLWLWCMGFSLLGFSCCRARALGTWALVVATYALSSCGSQTRAQAHYLWHRDFVASQHVGSSWTRDQTSISCIGRQILYHWATREAPAASFHFPQTSS